MRAPVNSFEFHPCGHTPQAAHLTRSLRHPGSCPDTQCASFTARTTRVSNPVRSPRLRASASAVRSQPAFAIGVLPDIYRFHPYTWNSGCATAAQAQQFPARFRGLGPGISRQACRAAYTPFTPNDSEQRSRLTCYRGCWHVISRRLFARYSHREGIPSSPYSSRAKGLYNLPAFLAHAASLRQGSPHCGIFLAAASRRSLGRISVPMRPSAL